MTQQPKEYGPLEKDIAAALVSAFVSPSHSIDTFSTWLLGGTAAAATLLIANVDKLGADTTKLLLIVLGISISFGLLQKFAALLLKYSEDVSTAMEKKAAELAARHAGEAKADPFAYIREKANVVDVVVLFVTAYPKFFRNYLIQKMFDTSKGPIEQSRSQISLLLKQFGYLSFQILFSVVALPVAIYAI